MEKGVPGTGTSCIRAAVCAFGMCYTVARSNRNPPEIRQNPGESCYVKFRSV